MTWDAEKAKRHVKKHGVSFETAKSLSPINRSEDERKSSTSFQQETQTSMSRERTSISLRKGIKISPETRELYEKRDRSLDADPETRSLPPERWANAMRRDEFFRPIKKLTTVRIDADVLDWLRSKGEGHLTRINDILREKMTSERGL